MKILIIDGYTDEPTCLGVPPYISPYPRYIYGAIRQAKPHTIIKYCTVDQIRDITSKPTFFNKFNVIIIIAGMVVPGKYLAGRPLSPREIIDFFKGSIGSEKILCGPAGRYGFGLSGGKLTSFPSELNNIFDLIISGDPDKVIHQFFSDKKNIDQEACHTTLNDVAIYAINGAEVVKQHPYFPEHLMVEIETYRGCSRGIVGGCSFCSEPSRGSPKFREVKDVITEVQYLHSCGIVHFRLGNQPCFFSYKSLDAENQEFPRPNVVAIEKLLKGIRQKAPNLKTLHIDNANPGILARYPKECRIIAKSIIKYHTPGDVAALGVESVDPIVISRNNLKANPEEVLDAIKLLNEVGSKPGYNGLPELLPGLNFIYGLPGETKKSYALALEFLQNILDSDHLVRRINIRQVLPLPGTDLENVGTKIISKHKSLFTHFKAQVRTHIERPLLKKIVPQETLLKDVFTECHEGHLTFGRQIGSYPLLIGIPGKINLGQFMDVKVVDYGFRSITAIPFPLDINTVPLETLEALPGIGKKRALRIIRARPYQNYEDIRKALDDEFVINGLRTFLGDELISTKNAGK
jgi:radical SAM superfamily enzyme with C-terminal helix-hairpin-helix motif